MMERATPPALISARPHMTDRWDLSVAPRPCRSPLAFDSDEYRTPPRSPRGRNVGDRNSRLPSVIGLDSVGQLVRHDMKLRIGVEPDVGDHDVASERTVGDFDEVMLGSRRIAHIEGPV